MSLPLPLPLPLKSHWVPSFWVWGSWLTVVGVLVSLALFTGSSLRQQLEDGAWLQADVAAKLVAMRIVSNVEHADAILLHTQETFNRLGPGLTAQDTLLKSRPLSQATLGQVVILNATGDPILAVPPGGDMPDYELLIAQASERMDDAPFSFTLSTDPQGRLNRVMPLRFDDGTFAGAVVVKMPTLWLAENLSEVASAYGLTMQLRQDKQVVALSIVVLTAGSFWLQRAIAERTRSRLRAEVARSEADLKSRFLANMSHELRTPMTGVLGAVELLQDTSPTAQQLSLLQLIERSGGAFDEHPQRCAGCIAPGVQCPQARPGADGVVVGFAGCDANADAACAFAGHCFVCAV